MVDPDHSVTCAICGEMADERRTVALDPDAQWESAPENFERIGRAYVAREVFGTGEAHNQCLESELLDAIEAAHP